MTLSKMYKKFKNSHILPHAKKKKNHPAQDVNNAKAEKPCSKDITMQQIFWAKIYLFGNTNKLKIIFFIAPISK